MHVRAVDADLAVIAPETVDELIHALRDRGYVVVGPTVRDGAVVVDELRGIADLPRGWRDHHAPGSYRLEHEDDGSLFSYVVGPQSPRQVVTPPHRRLWSARRNGGLTIDEDEPPAERYALFAVRPCELAALAVNDLVFGHDAVSDPHYVSVRDQAFIVAVNCARPASTCFCTSFDTGPAVGAEGYDLALTEVVDDEPHRIVVHAVTERGREVLGGIARTVASTADDVAAQTVTTRARAAITRRLDAERVREALAHRLDHARWDAVATRCLSCANCTLVCPTCFCTTVDDTVSLDGARAERVQRWDSCFTVDHSYIHGGAIRPDIRSRYRQWLTHKLSTWWDQFGVSGCVGCGRCITWCPAAIDLVEEAAAIAAEGTN